MDNFERGRLERLVYITKQLLSEFQGDPGNVGEEALLVL